MYEMLRFDAFHNVKLGIFEILTGVWFHSSHRVELYKKKGRYYTKSTYEGDQDIDLRVK